jgi:hypothetical protein
MITDFPANPVSNFAGLQLFSFSPYQNIAALPSISQKNIITPVTFVAGSQYLKGYSTTDQLSFSEKHTDDSNGGFYDWNISGYMPGDSDELINRMEEMRFSRYLVLTTDNNGILRLVGYNAPLVFTADFDSGKRAGTDNKGYSFAFTGQSRLRAPRYSA